VPAIEANKKAIDLLLRSYIELRENVGVEDRQKIQESINQLRRLAAEAFTTEKEKARKKRELLENEAKEELDTQTKLNDAIFAINATDQEKQLLAIEKKAQSFRDAGANEIDIARFVSASRNAIYQEEADKAAKIAQTLLDRRNEIAEKQADGETNTLRKIASEKETFAQDGLDILNEELDEQIELDMKELDSFIKKEEEKTRKLEEEAEKRKSIEEAIRDAQFRLAETAGNAVFEIFKSNLDRQLMANETQLQNELLLAGDNKEKQEEINNKFARKEAELKTKQAKADKAQALFNILLSTAQAVATASPIVPLMIFAAAIGAIQLAVVASRPIPQFYKGTENAPAGPISIAERGPEIIEKDGKRTLFQSPTILTGVEGSKIHTAEQSKRLMRSQDGSSIDIAAIVRSNNRIEKAIKNQPRLTYDKANRTITERGNKYSKTYLNRKLR
jgi:hypothetical protein